MNVERKHKSTCRSRLARIAGAALFCLFAAFAPAAHAMLLELQFHWSGSDMTAYNLQEGSIIQVIAYDSTDVSGPTYPATAGTQFEQYGTTTDTAFAAPYTSGSAHQLGGTGDDGKPIVSDVYLANTTPEGHEIKYTGFLQNLGTASNPWYGLYTQIQIDNEVYDTVYIRVFGATSIEQGELTASYWGISGTTELVPTFQFQNWTLEGNTFSVTNKNYFEVIPEPATLGLLGLGGCALVAWRRRRPRRQEEDNQ